MSAADPIFSPEWMNAWKEAINSSEAYSSTGSGWDEPVILKFSKPVVNAEEEVIPGLWLDLSGGKCRELRHLRKGDEDKAGIILTAEESVWNQLTETRQDPLFHLVSGRIRLEKGSMIRLSMQRKAARDLLGCTPQISAPEKESDEAPKPDQTRNASPEIQHTKPAAQARKSYSSTSRGLDFDSFPMQLFQKAKRHGIWDPAAIDFTRDREQWKSFTPTEKTVLMHLSSQFLAGEEAVTLDLLPLIQTVAKEGRLEEEMFLTTFLWEEAKHTEFFALFLRDVVVDIPDLEAFHGKAYRKLFGTELETALQRLQTDSSPEAQLCASVTYNMIVEGTLAETGYEAYFRMLTDNDMLPGLREGIGLLKRDESRHIAYGLYLIKRLIDAHPKLKPLLEREASRLLDMAIDVVDEMFEPYEVMPFGLDKSWYIDYAMNQFRKRMEKLVGQDAK